MSRKQAVVLAALAVVAGVVRLVSLGAVPPGIHVDSATNAYTAWCLLHTGADWHGAAWPILWSESFGESRTTLLYYLTLPFQAIGGMNAVTTRLPAAIAGTLTVPLLGWVGARWFGTRAGILAAAFLAMNPWHLFLSRTGLEPGLLPFAAVVLLAGAIGSEQPWAVNRPRPRRGYVGLAAGACTGVALYGYLGIRVFVAVAVVLAMAFAARAVIANRRSVVSWWVGLLVVAGPLIVAHLFAPTIARRATEVAVWQADASWLDNVAAVAGRYLAHFDPRFLFRDGDPYALHRLPDSGVLQGFLAPAILIGAVVLVVRFRGSVSARLVVACVLAYPVADAFTVHVGVHALRSGAGPIVFCLVAAIGAEWVLERFGTTRVRERALTAVVAATVVLGGALYLPRWFADYPRDPEVYALYNADVVAAWEWVGENGAIAEVDRVFCTTAGTGAFRQDFMIALYALRFPPASWAASSPRYVTIDGRRLCAGFGDIRFLGFRATLDDLRALEGNDTIDPVLFLVRPGESPRLRDPIHVLRNPQGQVTLEIHRVDL